MNLIPASNACKTLWPPSLPRFSFMPGWDPPSLNQAVFSQFRGSARSDLAGHVILRGLHNYYRRRNTSFLLRLHKEPNGDRPWRGLDSCRPLRCLSNPATRRDVVLEPRENRLSAPTGCDWFSSCAAGRLHYHISLGRVANTSRQWPSNGTAGEARVTSLGI
jgi:hypothetical protein